MIRLEINTLDFMAGKKNILDLGRVEFSTPSIYGVVGPNGSGKSTLLKAICGIIENYSGNININGLSTKDSHSKIAEIMGSLIETPTFYPYSTPLQFLRYNIEMRTGKKITSVNDVNLLLEKVGLSLKGAQKTSTLSTGELKRLGIASAFAGDPFIVLLDEPTENLDPLGKEMIKEFLTEWAEKDDRMVILTSHDISFLEQVCKKVIFLKKGKIAGEMDIHGGKNITLFLESKEDSENIPMDFNIVKKGEGYVTIEGNITPFLKYAEGKNIIIKDIVRESPLKEKYMEIFSY